VYFRATWRPTRRTVEAQRLPAHVLLSLYKGDAVPHRLLLRTPTPQALRALCPHCALRRRCSSTVRHSLANFVELRSAETLRWASAVAAPLGDLCSSSAVRLLRLRLRLLSGGRRLQRLPPLQVSLDALILLLFSPPCSWACRGFTFPSFFGFSLTRRSSRVARSWEKCLWVGLDLHVYRRVSV
jgi:hypothetical protein